MEIITEALATRTDEQIVSDYRQACINFRAGEYKEWGPMVLAIETDMKRRGLGDLIDVILDELDAEEDAA